MRWVYDDGGRSEAGFKGEAEDCVCRAVAIASELPYKPVYDALNALTRAKRVAGKSRSSARTGVPRKVYQPWLDELGWQWHPTMKIGSGCRVHLKDGEIPMEGRLIVRLSKHLCAVVDGVIHDTHDPSRNGTRCVYGYWRLERSRR